MRGFRLLQEGGGLVPSSPPRSSHMPCLLYSSSPALFNHLFSSSYASSPTPDVLRPAAAVSMSGNSSGLSDADVARQKRALRSKIRKDLEALSPAQRCQEDAAIQKIVLESSWFSSCMSLCAYISCNALREVDTSIILSQISRGTVNDGRESTKKKLYVPRVEDKNSHMRMLHISTLEDLAVNSINIPEPSLMDANGNPREDVMLASDPVDVFLLPGLAFDKSGRRIGRGGGYYDAFLRKYWELAAEREWKQPLLVALGYSVQIIDEGVIPVTPHDVPVDAIVCPSGVVRVNAAACERM